MAAEPQEPSGCCFDEWAAQSARRARERGSSGKITARLVAALADVGLARRTVLDVGCGAGDLALETLSHGADRAIGYDLGPGAIRTARSLAAERGLSERTSFHVGDGAEVPLPSADVVTLNRVLCCYPHVDALLANTLPAAGAVYGITAPVDAGLIGWGNRISLAIENRWYRLRSRRFGGFQAYVHDLDRVDERIRAAGFVPLRRERVGLWHLAVYARQEPPPPTR